MTSADFYIGLGRDAEWLGSLEADGTAAEMDEYNLFGPGDPDDDLFTEDTFRRIVWDVLAEARGENRGHMRASGDAWPWEYPDSSSGTDMVYVFNNGSIHVFERNGDDGLFQIALHYPNGTRKPAVFPRMVS